MEQENRTINIVHTYEPSQYQEDLLNSLNRSSKIEGFFYTVGVAATVLLGVNVIKRVVKKLEARDEAKKIFAEEPVNPVKD